MADGMTIKLNATDLLKNIDKIKTKFSDKEYGALTMLLQTAATKMESWAKDNAPWTDRSGAARQRLKGDVFWENPRIVSVAIMHQVDYGIWLELAHERKYAILEKALDANKVEIMSAVATLLKKING